MRAILVSAASALCVVGCSQQAIPPPAHIVGTNSLALVNDLLFVTSPGASELRVLDLRVSPRDFVRAPNPLEPLSIPVLNAPTVLARDITYDANGDIDDTTYDPYVYAQGAAAGEISIVGTRRDSQLVELKRLVIGETVTAIAARGPTGGSPSTLYFATLGSGQGRLWQLPIPPSDPTGRLADPGAPLPLRYGVGSAYQSDPITSIAVLPGNRIAVASRAAGARTGRTIILDFMSDPNVQQSVLDFPSPVRQLVTHPTIYALNPDGTPALNRDGSPLRRLDAGARIFGVLDDDACPPPPPLLPPPYPDCPGILAVEGLRTRTGPDGMVVANPRFGMRSLDATGYRMLPIRLGIGLISGLSVAPTTVRYRYLAEGTEKAGVPLVNGSGAVTTFDFLGIASTSSGQIFFFDASALTLINISTVPAQVTNLQYVDSAGGIRTYTSGPLPGAPRTDISSPPPFPGVKVATGAAADPSELVSVVFQGVITDFRDLGPVTLSEFQLPYGTGDARRLIPGKDSIVVSGADGCSAEVLLSAVDFAHGMLQTTTRIPCTGAATFSVRACGCLQTHDCTACDQPYVVSGTATGYMGRTGNNQDFAFPANVADRYARYYYHPLPNPDYPEVAFDPTVPQIQFTMGPGAPDIQRDWQYAMVVDAKFSPEFVTVDVNIGIEFHSPGASAYVGALSDLTDISRLYVAYPSANAVLEFPPQLLIPNSPNARNVAAFR